MTDGAAAIALAFECSYLAANRCCLHILCLWHIVYRNMHKHLSSFGGDSYDKEWVADGVPQLSFLDKFFFCANELDDSVCNDISFNARWEEIVKHADTKFGVAPVRTSRPVGTTDNADQLGKRTLQLPGFFC